MKTAFRIIAYLYLIVLTVFLLLNHRLMLANWLELGIAIIYFICLLLRVSIVDRIVGLFSATMAIFLLISLYKDFHSFEIIIFSLAFVGSLMIYVYRAQKS